MLRRVLHCFIAPVPDTLIVGDRLGARQQAGAQCIGVVHLAILARNIRDAGTLPSWKSPGRQDVVAGAERDVKILWLAEVLVASRNAWPIKDVQTTVGYSLGR